MRSSHHKALVTSLCKDVLTIDLPTLISKNDLKEQCTFLTIFI